ncbi:MAG: two-component system cell cycle sensor histidine kinase/response regulator CckA [Verrucomicrobiales bacterium]|jgi:two-component system cell cycle sensor histidine kinase/response regulator CckA
MNFPQIPGKSEQPESLPMPNGNETILVVEDEDLLRSLSTQILISLGYRVIEAADGRIAYELVKDYPRRIDLILSDVVLPKLKGPEMVSRARELRNDFKVLYTSGYTENSFGDIFDASPEERAAEMLPKPFTPEELASQVRKVLDDPEIDAEQADCAEPVNPLAAAWDQLRRV